MSDVTDEVCSIDYSVTRIERLLFLSAGMGWARFFVLLMILAKVW